MALEHAASVAGMMLTTEAAIAEWPQKEKPEAGGAARGRWYGWYGRNGWHGWHGRNGWR